MSREIDDDSIIVIPKSTFGKFCRLDVKPAKRNYSNSCYQIAAVLLKNTRAFAYLYAERGLLAIFNFPAAPFQIQVLGEQFRSSRVVALRCSKYRIKVLMKHNWRVSVSVYVSSAPIPPGRRFWRLSGVTIITKKAARGRRKKLAHYQRLYPLFVPGRPTIVPLFLSLSLSRDHTALGTNGDDVCRGK